MTAVLERPTEVVAAVAPPVEAAPVEEKFTLGKLVINGYAGKGRVVEWDTRDEASVKVAQEAFDSALADGMLGYEKTPDGAYATTRTFDPTSAEQTFTAQLVGG